MSRKSIDKSLLKNIIKHTDAHNKIQEQNEMWKQWEFKKQSRKQNHSPVMKRQIRGYMRSDAKVSSHVNEESLKWNHLLMDYEESCKDRWGHGGYEELYPDESRNRDSNRSDLESKELVNSDKQEKINEESRVEKQKRKKSKKKKMKKKRKLNLDGDDSDSGTDRKHKKSKSASSVKHSRSNETKSTKKRKKRTKH